MISEAFLSAEKGKNMKKEENSLLRDLVDPVKSFAEEVGSDTVGDAKRFYAAQARKMKKNAEEAKKQAERRKEERQREQQELKKHRQAVMKRAAIVVAGLIVAGFVILSLILNSGV